MKFEHLSFKFYGFYPFNQITGARRMALFTAVESSSRINQLVLRFSLKVTGLMALM